MIVVNCEWGWLLFECSVYLEFGFSMLVVLIVVDVVVVWKWVCVVVFVGWVWGSSSGVDCVWLFEGVVDVLVVFCGCLIEVMVVEMGKIIVELDVEVSEVVDFVCYYVEWV